VATRAARVKAIDGIGVRVAIGKPEGVVDMVNMAAGDPEVLFDLLRMEGERVDHE
jgi:hypothetical protein